MLANAGRDGTREGKVLEIQVMGAYDDVSVSGGTTGCVLGASSPITAMPYRRARRRYARRWGASRQAMGNE